MSKAFFKNSKPYFEKRVYVLLGHRRLSLNGNDGLKPISALILAVMNFGYANRKVSYEEKCEIPYVSLK